VAPDPPIFLSNYAGALVCLSDDPCARASDIARILSITERAAQRILSDLVREGYASRTREGRRNRYELNLDKSLDCPFLPDAKLRDLLALASPNATPG
jgi:DNA-binding transcriptional ArsR family regulator